MACTIAVATHKGGTAKTVTSMALAAALARLSKRCLLVDIDPQSHSTIGMGIELADTDPTLHDVLTDSPTTVGRAIRDTHLSHLHLLPASIRLARDAQMLYTRPKREELLTRVLRPVASRYEFIVIDCPPSLGSLTEMGIAAADLLIIPCQMEARAADGLVDLLEVVSLIKGESFDHWRILLTRVDPRKTITNQAVREALATWKNKFLKTWIPQSESLNQAQIARTDIFSFEPKSRGALAYKALTQEIVRTYGH